MTISHQTAACPAIVIEVKTSPLMAKSGMKYVRIEAVGMLAVFLGTWELLLRTVGKLKIARPALPIEINMSTNVNLVRLHHHYPLVGYLVAWTG